MEFSFKPLKVPDLKISPKSLDYSSRDSSSAHEDASRILIAHGKEGLQKDEKGCKNGDRGQRKLDFSTSGASSVLNLENIEPLKAPDVSIYSSLGKKEKENRSKKQKKEEFNVSKSSDDAIQDKRLKNKKLIPRKNAIDPLAGQTRIERYPSRVTARENNLNALKKPKNRSFLTSTERKDEQHKKRHSSKLAQEKTLLPKNQFTSSESLSIKSQELYRSSYHDHCCPSRQNEKLGTKQQSRSSSKEKSKQSRKSSATSEISEDLEMDTNLRQSESSPQSKSARSLDNMKYREGSVVPENSKELAENLIPESMIDIKKITFRNDAYLPQLEFNDIVTPDVNLLRMKRKKQILQEEAAKGSKLGKEEEMKLVMTFVCSTLLKIFFTVGFIFF